jgi:hypothetical protein
MQGKLEKKISFSNQTMILNLKNFQAIAFALCIST